MKWYPQNLLSGLRTALFLPAPRDFAASWHALAAIAATTVLSQLALEFAIDGRGGEWGYSWYEYQVCLFSLVLLASYAAGSLACKGGRVLDIAVAFLNAYYFIFLPYALVKIMAAEKFYESGLAPLVERAILVWAFLVMFRIASRHAAGDNALKLVVSGLAAAGALYLLNSQVYFSRIYYVHESSGPQETSPLDKMTSEEVFGLQPGLRRKELEKLAKSKPGETDIYALTLGTYAHQKVFLRDVNYVGTRLKDRLGVTNILPMVNNKTTVETTPLANTTNLQAYLGELAKHYMQPEEDILFIYLTSHGSAENGLTVNLGYQFSQLDISPQRLQKILRDSGIRNRVIVIAACYSGVFIPPLQDDNTMVMTAAAADRMSFGCSDESPLTYFTEAYFLNALSRTTDLEKAFAVAQDVVKKREDMGNVEKNSNPQIFVGGKIREALRKYKGASIAATE